MVEIAPFRGYVYDPRRVPFADAIAPPYDRIEDPNLFHARSPHNVVHLIVPDPASGPTREERFAQAAARFRSWIDQGVVRRQENMALYPYHQLFTVGRRSYTRRGIVCLLRLEKPGGRLVLPHEQTNPEFLADRLAFLRAFRANLGQLFLLYRDPEQRVERAMARFVEGPALVQAELEGGVLHRLWAAPDPAAIAEATLALGDKILYIADGHHRYETAWNYRAEIEDARGNVHYQGSAGFRMATLINTEQPGLVILATHRVLPRRDLPEAEEIARRLEDLFDLRRYPFHGDVDRARVWTDFEEDLRLEGTAGPAFGMYRAGDRELLLVLPRDRAAIASALESGSEARRAVDVSVLHELVLPRLFDPAPEHGDFQYVRGAEDAWSRVVSGAARSAIFVNAPRLEQVLGVAEAGERMPAKSTDFFPKLATGIVMHRMEDP